VILVLAHHYDAEAEWLCGALRRHRQAALLLCPEALGVDYRISLFLGGNGRHDSRVSFFHPQAHTFQGRCARYAINRLGYVEPLIWKQAESTEKAYATSEINAFFSAFVRALLCPVSNPVRNGALWAGSGFEAKWLSRLQRFGATVHPLATAPPAEALAALNGAGRETIRRWLHVDGELFSPPDQESSYSDVERAILDQGPDEMLEFIGIHEASSPRPKLLWVTRTPALSCYGPNLVAALIDRAEADPR
jgi:hypothetical protein